MGIWPTYLVCVSIILIFKFIYCKYNRYVRMSDVLRIQTKQQNISTPPTYVHNKSITCIGYVGIE